MCPMNWEDARAAVYDDSLTYTFSYSNLFVWVKQADEADWSDADRERYLVAEYCCLRFAQRYSTQNARHYLTSDITQIHSYTHT